MVFNFKEDSAQIFWIVLSGVIFFIGVKYYFVQYITDYFLLFFIVGFILMIFKSFIVRKLLNHDSLSLDYILNGLGGILIFVSFESIIVKFVPLKYYWVLILVAFIGFYLHKPLAQLTIKLLYR